MLLAAGLSLGYISYRRPLAIPLLRCELKARSSSSQRPEILMSESDAAETHAELEASTDHYDGRIVSAAALPTDPRIFAARLRASLNTWSAAGVRGVWLKLHLSQAGLVVKAVEQGFVYHHAEPDYLMLTRWLPAAQPCTLPANASHQVGVGAFVVNSRGQVLAVQERSGVLRGRGVWKMPTGLVAAGEDLTMAAERELMEETGVAARVEAVLALRQAHGFAFGKSDMFVVLGMRPHPDEQEPVPQEAELEAAAWLPLSEFMSQQFFKDMPLYGKMMDRCVAWAEGRYSGLKAEKLESNIVRPRSDLLVWGEDDAVLAATLAALGSGNAESQR